MSTVNQVMKKLKAKGNAQRRELFLVDGSWRPACAALQLLDEIDDEHFTTELAQFNLEMNLDPHEFDGDCEADALCAGLAEADGSGDADEPPVSVDEPSQSPSQ